MKLKSRLSGAKNKKPSQTETELDNFTRYKFSRFEYEEGKDKSRNILVKKSDLNKKQKKEQSKKQTSDSSQDKKRRKGKSWARVFEITLIDFEKEEELDLIIDTRSNKVDQSTTRSIGMSIQNILKG